MSSLMDVDRFHDAMVNEWSDRYFPYEELMRRVRELPVRARGATGSSSSSPLLGRVSRQLSSMRGASAAGEGDPEGEALRGLAEETLGAVADEEAKVNEFFLAKETVFGDRVRAMGDYLSSHNVAESIHRVDPAVFAVTIDDDPITEDDGLFSGGGIHNGAFDAAGAAAPSSSVHDGAHVQSGRAGASSSKSKKSKSEIETIRTALEELYRGLLLLQNYATLNYTAVADVRKAVDDVCSTSRSTWYVLRDHVRPAHAYVNAKDRLEPILSEVECRYAVLFTGGSVSAAKTALFERKQPPPQTFLNIFNLGFFSGFSIPLLVLTMSLLFTSSAVGYDPEADLYPVIPVFRCTGVLILVFWLWGGVVWLFENQRINHVFILELRPQSSLGHLRIFKSGALMAALWLSCFLLFLASVRRGINVFPVHHNVYPAILVGTLAALLICPLPMLHRPTRSWLLTRSLRVMAAPLCYVSFSDNLIGDYMTSLVKVMYDAEYLACFYFTGDWLTNDYARCQETNRRYALPVLTALPLFWRLLQCFRRIYDTGDWWPHTANAGKYAVATLAVTLGAFHSDWKSYGHEYTPSRISWLGLLVFSTLYAYTWDICMDWGLVWYADGKIHTRKRFQYGSPWVYALAAVFNLFGRFVWMLTLITAPVQSAVNHELAVFVYAMVEVVRRSVWAALRIEHEHSFNASQFRAVNPLPLAFHADTEIKDEAFEIFDDARLGGGDSGAVGDLELQRRE